MVSTNQVIIGKHDFQEVSHTDFSFSSSLGRPCQGCDPSSCSSKWPIITGWGGVRLDEATASSANPPSRVFVAEAASNMEMIIRLLWERGNNGMRVGFES